MPRHKQTHVQATLLSFFSVFSPLDLLKTNTPYSVILGSSSALFLKCLLYTSRTDSGVGQRVKMLFYHALIESILRHGIWARFYNGSVNTGPHSNPNPNPTLEVALAWLQITRLVFPSHRSHSYLTHRVGVQISTFPAWQEPESRLVPDAPPHSFWNITHNSPPSHLSYFFWIKSPRRFLAQ